MWLSRTFRRFNAFDSTDIHSIPHCQHIVMNIQIETMLYIIFCRKLHQMMHTRQLYLISVLYNLHLCYRNFTPDALAQQTLFSQNFKISIRNITLLIVHFIIDMDFFRSCRIFITICMKKQMILKKTDAVSFKDSFKYTLA